MIRQYVLKGDLSLEPSLCSRRPLWRDRAFVRKRDRVFLRAVLLGPCDKWKRRTSERFGERPSMYLSESPSVENLPRKAVPYSRVSAMSSKTNLPSSSFRAFLQRASDLPIYFCSGSLLSVSGIAVLSLLMAFPLLAQDRSYGRSMVVTDRGIVATSQVLASQAGARVLKHGGSAIDAAIAANAVLGVTEPMMNGIGGDLFLLYWDAKSGKLYGLNASGWAPRNLTIEHLKTKGITSMPESGIDRVTVPGAVDGRSQAHQKFRRMPWKGCKPA